MNSCDGFDVEEGEDKDKPSTEDLDKRNKIIKDYRDDLRKDFPADMSERDWKKLISQFDAFVTGWDKEYKKSNHRDKAKKNSLKDFEMDLKLDPDLTNYEKFELYYDEYSKRNPIEEKGTSYNKMLKELGIKPTPKKK